LENTRKGKNLSGRTADLEGKSSGGSDPTPNGEEEKGRRQK